MALFDVHGQPLSRGVPGGQEPAPGQADLRELALPGTLLFSGIPLEEQNPALQGRRGMDTYKAMGHDPTMAMLLKVIELPLRACDWHVDPADDSEEAVELADFVHYNLFEFGVSGSQSTWDDTVRMAVSGRMQYGFSLHEIVYRVDDDRYPGQVCIDKLAFRAQWTVYKWNVEEIDMPDGGRMRKLVSITQLAPPYYQFIVLPSNKFLLWSRDMTGENYPGIPLFRACFKPWWIRDRLYNIQTVGLERAYMGMPVGKLPMTYTADMKDLMTQIVQGLRTHEHAGAVIRDDMGLEILHNQLEGDAMYKAIEWLTYEIARSALAQFTMLGSNTVGSFALSVDQSDLFLMGLNSEANYTAEVMNLEPGIPTLVRFNYPDTPNSMMPKVGHGLVGQRNLDKLMRGLATMIQWGGIVPDDTMEDALREMIGLPEREGTITPDYLQSLLQGMNDPNAQHEWEIVNDPSRPPMPPGREGLPGTPLASTGKVVNAVGPPTSGPTPSSSGPRPSGNNPGPAQASIKAAEEYQQAITRRRMARPQGRLTDVDRMRIRAGEELLAMAESARHSDKPDYPSVRLAKTRRPYRLQEGIVRLAEKTGTWKRPEVQLADAANPKLVALKHRRAMKDFFSALGKPNLSDKEAR